MSFGGELLAFAELLDLDSVWDLATSLGFSSWRRRRTGWNSDKTGRLANSANNFNASLVIPRASYTLRMDDSHPIPGRPLLAVDTSSPIVSLSLSLGSTVLVERTLKQKQSSRALLPTIDEMLRGQSLELKDLGGLVGLSGPGSFTGLRVGLATLMGLHQATTLPARTLSTLRVLAFCAVENLASQEAPSSPSQPMIVAVVDALRGNVYVQAFRGDPQTEALDEPRCLPAAELPANYPEANVVVAFGTDPAPGRLGWPDTTLWVGAPPLASPAARLAQDLSTPWDASTLAFPLYLRAPAVSLPKAFK